MFSLVKFVEFETDSAHRQTENPNKGTVVERVVVIRRFEIAGNGEGVGKTTASHGANGSFGKIRQSIRKQ
jgi:hypothetical protein